MWAWADVVVLLALWWWWLLSAREMGYPLRLSDIAIETLVPKGTKLQDLAQSDQAVAQKAAQAAERGCVLR